MDGMLAIKIVGDSVGMEKVLKPVRKENEALIRVKRAGICNTDLEIIKGYSNFQNVLGHEFVGIIEDVSPDNVIKPGERVVGHINIVCETCNVCSLGGDRRRNHCPNREVLGIVEKNGAHAQYITLPVENLLVVPDEISDKQATFAEPLAAACRIVEQGLVKAEDAVCVIGDGKLGLLIVEVLAQESLSRLVLIGKHPNKMSLAPENVERVILDEHTGRQFSNSFDLTVEASGSPSGISLATDITRPLGTISLKTTIASDSSMNLSRLVVKEIKMIGSRCGPLKKALELIESGKIDLYKFVYKEFPFKEGLDAYASLTLARLLATILSWQVVPFLGHELGGYRIVHD